MSHTYSTSALDYFADLVRVDGTIPLFEAALLIAQDAEVPIDLCATQSEVDSLVARLKPRVTQKQSDIQKLRLLLQFFYQDLGFSPNLNNYSDPENSYLHCVLTTRRGIPISLAVLFIEMAGQIGLKVEGVSFPGHFLLKMRVPDGEIILDPMTGISLSVEQISQLIMPHINLGTQYSTQDEDKEELTRAQLQHFLQAASVREILARMLRNLKYIYTSEGAWAKVLQVLQRLAILEPDNLQTIRDRGFAYANIDKPQRALRDLEMYLHIQTDAQDAEEIRAMLPSLHAAARRKL